MMIGGGGYTIENVARFIFIFYFFFFYFEKTKDAGQMKQLLLLEFNLSLKYRRRELFMIFTNKIIDCIYK